MSGSRWFERLAQRDISVASRVLRKKFGVVVDSSVALLGRLYRAEVRSSPFRNYQSRYTFTSFVRLFTNIRPVCVPLSVCTRVCTLFEQRWPVVHAVFPFFSDVIILLFFDAVTTDDVGVLHTHVRNTSVKITRSFPFPWNLLFFFFFFNSCSKLRFFHFLSLLFFFF